LLRLYGTLCLSLPANTPLLQQFLFAFCRFVYELINENLLKPRYDDINDTEAELQDMKNSSDSIEINFDLVDNDEEVKIGNMEGANPLSGNLFQLTPDFAKNRYFSYGDLVYFAKDTMSNAPQYEDENMIEIERHSPVAVTSTERPVATTVSKRMHSKTRNISGGIGAGIKLQKDSESELELGLSWNSAKGSSVVLSDYMDINGDGYPDIISEYGVIYTQPQGRLSTSPIMFNDGKFINTTASSGQTTSWSGGVSSIEIRKEPKNSPKFSSISVSCGVSNTTQRTLQTLPGLILTGTDCPTKLIKKTDRGRSL